jgi:hypothetical protein
MVFLRSAFAIINTYSVHDITKALKTRIPMAMDRNKGFTIKTIEILKIHEITQACQCPL